MENIAELMYEYKIKHSKLPKPEPKPKINEANEKEL
jgi:hypothetical protein